MDVWIFGFEGWDDLIRPNGKIIITPAFDRERHFLGWRRRSLSRFGAAGGKDHREGDQQTHHHKYLTHFLLLFVKMRWSIVQHGQILGCVPPFSKTLAKAASFCL